MSLLTFWSPKCKRCLPFFVLHQGIKYEVSRMKTSYHGKTKYSVCPRWRHTTSWSAISDYSQWTYPLLPCKLTKVWQFIYKPPEQNFSLEFWLLTWNIQLFEFSMKTNKNIMWKPQKTMSNVAVLSWERWINPESCTPKEGDNSSRFEGQTVPWEHFI